MTEVPKSAGMRTPSLEGPIAERNEGVSKLNLVKSAIWCLRRQFKISWWFCSIFLKKKKKFLYDEVEAYIFLFYGGQTSGKIEKEQKLG